MDSTSNHSALQDSASEPSKPKIPRIDEVSYFPTSEGPNKCTVDDLCLFKSQNIFVGPSSSKAYQVPAISMESVESNLFVPPHGLDEDVDEGCCLDEDFEAESQDDLLMLFDETT